MKKVTLILIAILSICSISAWYLKSYIQIYYAKDGGTVIFNGFTKECGNILVLKSNFKPKCDKDENCMKRMSRYKYGLESCDHLPKQPKFKVGDVIRVGQLIAWQKSDTIFCGTQLATQDNIDNIAKNGDRAISDIFGFCDVCLYQDCD